MPKEKRDKVYYFLKDFAKFLNQSLKKYNGKIKINDGVQRDNQGRVTADSCDGTVKSGQITGTGAGSVSVTGTVNGFIVNMPTINEDLQNVYDVCQEILDEVKSLRGIKNDLVSGVFCSQVAQTVLDKFKEQYPQLVCKDPNNSEVQVLFALGDLKAATVRIKKGIDEIVNDKNMSANEINEKLKALQKETKKGIDALSKQCGDILYWAQKGYQLCVDNFEALNKNDKNIRELIQQFMLAAGKRHHAIMEALDHNAAVELSPGLDMTVIAEMFEYIKNLPNSEKEFEDTITEKTTEIKAIVNNTADNVEQTLDVCRKSYSMLVSYDAKLDKIESMVEETNQKAEETKLLLLKRINNEYKEYDKDKRNLNNANLSNEEKMQFEKQLREREDKINELQYELFALESSGIKLTLSCPYCGNPSEKIMIDYECRCSICGQRFTGINPDIKSYSNSRIIEDLNKMTEENKKKLRDAMGNDEEKAKEWRKDHTAELEKVGEYLYRIKLDKYTVSSKGVLIIPPKCRHISQHLNEDLNDENTKITTIVFCQPNTDDIVSQERMKKVKTLILPMGATLKKFNDIVPFAEIKDNLDKVLQFKADGTTEEATDICDIIKGRKESA